MKNGNILYTSNENTLKEFNINVKKYRKKIAMNYQKNVVKHCKVILFVVLMFFSFGSSYSFAYPTVLTVPDVTNPSFGDSVKVSVNIDLTAGSDSIGAYSFEITWDETVLDYAYVTGGTSVGFTSVNKNDSNAGSGSLLINQFYAQGIDGVVNVAQISFTAMDVANSSTSIVPIVSSLTASVTFNDLTPGLIINSGQVTVNNTHTISGTVTGTGGVTVTLSDDASGSQTLTNDGDSYTFTVSDGGTYTVTPSKSGYTFSPSSQTFTNVTADATQNFTAQQITHTISGTVTGTGGVTVTLSDDASGSQTLTNDGDSYTFTVSDGGTYTVTPSKSGYTFSPSSQTFTNVTADATQNFTAQQIMYTLTMAVDPTEGGTTDPSVGTNTYSSGTVVNIEAMPETVYEFVNWTVNTGANVAEPDNTSTTVTMDTDKTVTANFALYGIWGDIDDNDIVDVVDALKIATYDVDPLNTALQSLIPFITQRGDVNNDTFINSTDALICATYELDPGNPSLPERVGKALGSVAKVASLPDAKSQSYAIPYINVNPSENGIYIIEASISADNSDVTVGAATIKIMWDPNKYRYVGLESLQENVALNNKLAHNGELRMARIDVYGENPFTFPKIYLKPLGENKMGNFTFEILNASEAGTFQEFSFEFGGSVSITTGNDNPEVFELKQNVPNPFNPVTTIQYSLAIPSNIKLEIFNIQGQKVKSLVDGFKRAGIYSVVWDGTDDYDNMVGSGIYIYQLSTPDFREHKHMSLVR